MATLGTGLGGSGAWCSNFGDQPNVPQILLEIGTKKGHTMGSIAGHDLRGGGRMELSSECVSIILATAASR
jgi:hypothetical protein